MNKWPRLPKGAKSFSHTQLEEFRCPLRWKRRRIDREPEPVSDALLKGRLAHDVVAAYLRHLLEHRLETDVTAIDEIAKRSFFEPTQPHGLPFSEFQEILRMAKAFAGRFVFDYRTTVEIEQPWALELGDNAYFWVILDLLQIDGVRAIITDFKTDWHVRAQTDLEHDSQLHTYCWAVHREFPHITEFTVRLDFLRHGVVREAEFNLEVVDEADTMIRASVAAIQREKLFQPNPGKHCGFCPYVASCEYPGSVPNLTVIATPEQARAIAAKVIVLEEQVKRLKNALKDWSTHWGPVEAEGIVFGYHLTESYGLDDPRAFYDAMTAAGLDPWDFLTVTGSKVKRIMHSEDLQNVAGHLVIDKSYTRFSSKKAEVNDVEDSSATS